LTPRAEKNILETSPQQRAWGDVVIFPGKHGRFLCFFYAFYVFLWFSYFFLWFFYDFPMLFYVFFAMFFASYVFLIKKPCGTPGFFRLKHVDFRSTFPLSIGRTCSGFGARSLFSKTPIQRDEERRKGGDSDRSLGLYPKVPSSGVTYFYMELKQPY
jgi:hypothetical protein